MSEWLTLADDGEPGFNRDSFAFVGEVLLGGRGHDLLRWDSYSEAPQLLWKAPATVGHVVAAPNDSGRIAAEVDGEIWILTAGADGPRKLIPQVAGVRPVWSPDGARIAVASGTEGFSVVDVDSGTITTNRFWPDADPVQWDGDGVLLEEHDQLGKFREWYYLWREGTAIPVELEQGAPYWTSANGELRVRSCSGGFDVECAGVQRRMSLPKQHASALSWFAILRAPWIGDHCWGLSSYGLVIVDLSGARVALVPAEPYTTFVVASRSGDRVLVEQADRHRVVLIEPSELEWTELQVETIDTAHPFPPSPAEPRPEPGPEPGPEPEPGPGPGPEPKPETHVALAALDIRLRPLAEALIAIDEYDSEFGSGEWLEERRNQCLDQLVALGNPGLELLATALELEWPPGIAGAAATRLGELGARALPYFDRLLAVPAARWASFAAAAACVRIAPLDALGSGLFRNPKHRIRQGALSAVDDATPAPIISELVELLHHPDTSTRRDALATLRHHPAFEPMTMVPHLLRDPSADIRAIACSILARLPEPAVVPMLISALREDPLAPTPAYKRIADSPEAVFLVQTLLDRDMLGPDNLDGWQRLEILVEHLGRARLRPLRDRILEATGHAMSESHRVPRSHFHDIGALVRDTATRIASALRKRRG
jgi:hypothetical protein